MSHINYSDKKKTKSKQSSSINTSLVQQDITSSWSKVAPFWPLKNLVAVNPIAGFESLPFEEAMKQAQVYFQQASIPKKMVAINLESIKWLQAYFDEGQSTLKMPLRESGFLKCLLTLFTFDKKLHKNQKKHQQWLTQLPQKPESIIAESLLFLGIPTESHELFLTLMLTTLPGWASHIQYRASWAPETNAFPVSQAEYLAFRLVITCLLWPEAKALLDWHSEALEKADTSKAIEEMTKTESAYQHSLLKQLGQKSKPNQAKRKKAQMVFCIDVRSEPVRRLLEEQGDYETFGFAGFFGIPLAVSNAVTKTEHASCPVLLKPSHTVSFSPCNSPSYSQRYQQFKTLKRLYQSLKYTFSTPFYLVEMIGWLSGVAMMVKSIFPRAYTFLKKNLNHKISPQPIFSPDISSISVEQQVNFAKNALNLMGLTTNFAPLVIFCGHGSTTANNAYASMLDCGACGGHHGAPNASVLADILNAPKVRQMLKLENILIPDDTLFLAAKHNTTTDDITVFKDKAAKPYDIALRELSEALQQVKMKSCALRSSTMGVSQSEKKAEHHHQVRANDWAQIRPEWGLAKNAAFIVGPRGLSESVNLDGRTFLHSYNWENDNQGEQLSTILTAPMVVAQWINAQYLFSTMDNIAFGSGSKITQNITGKIGVMQGNASDLMHGLPLQSVNQSDTEAYHEIMRLSVIIYAPKALISSVIEQHTILQSLFGLGWVHAICIEPETNQRVYLQRDLTWSLGS